MMQVLRPHFAWVYLLVAIVGMGQSPQSVTYCGSARALSKADCDCQPVLRIGRTHFVSST